MTVMVAKTVVERCVAGETAAWRDLHREYHPIVRRFLRRLGVPSGEADDAVQEVFVQVFRYLARFEQRAELTTWIYKLCISQASRWRRRAWLRAPLRWMTGDELATLELVASDGFTEAEMHRRIAAALMMMKARHREVLVLHQLEGLPGDEVARILACPVATVWRRLHYARHEFENLVLGHETKGRLRR